MNRIILQVPMDKNLKEKAETVSADLGFSSLQEILRVLVTKLAKKEITFKVEEKREYIRLSPQAKKRYVQMKEDFKTGKNIYKPKNIDEFFEQLSS